MAERDSRAGSSARVTEEELELLVDLHSAADEAGVELFLIGAGALRLGYKVTEIAEGPKWHVRLVRSTRDWDFAVRVESWPAFERLRRALLERGNFRALGSHHKFIHCSEQELDVVPYGGLEDPPGKIDFESGLSMDTRGLGVLDEHYQVLDFGALELRRATLPVMLGLKLLAYGDRRSRGVRHDIGDALAILGGHEEWVLELDAIADVIDARAPRLYESEDVTFENLGSYLLGLDLAEIFDPDDSRAMVTLLAEVADSGSRLVVDARAEVGAEIPMEARLEGLRLGLIDGLGRRPEG